MGLENNSLDVSEVLHCLLSKGNGMVEKARKANQWLINSFETSKYQSFVGEFYFNNGTLTGKTILNQFTNVVLSCEAIGSQVLGLVLDAGGSNANFINLLRDGETLTTASWINDQECYISNPRYPSRRIYFWFCVTHLFKAFWNQLYASCIGPRCTLPRLSICPMRC